MMFSEPLKENWITPECPLTGFPEGLNILLIIFLCNHIKIFKTSGYCFYGMDGSKRLRSDLLYRKTTFIIKDMENSFERLETFSPFALTLVLHRQT